MQLLWLAKSMALADRISQMFVLIGLRNAGFWVVDTFVHFFPRSGGKWVPKRFLSPQQFVSTGPHNKGFVVGRHDKVQFWIHIHRCEYDFLFTNHLTKACWVYAFSSQTLFTWCRFFNDVQVTLPLSLSVVPADLLCSNLAEPLGRKPGAWAGTKRYRAESRPVPRFVGDILHRRNSFAQVDDVFSRGF